MAPVESRVGTPRYPYLLKVSSQKSPDPFTVSRDPVSALTYADVSCAQFVSGLRPTIA